MSNWEEKEQPFVAGAGDWTPDHNHVSSGRTHDVNRRQNWAWATPQGQYDWMDLNLPFIDIG
jgi:hypothetical protein